MRRERWRSEGRYEIDGWDNRVGARGERDMLDRPRRAPEVRWLGSMISGRGWVNSGREGVRTESRRKKGHL